MLLVVTLRGSSRRPRSRKPDVLGFATEREEGRLRVPLLVVTRTTRAKRLTGHLVTPDGARERVRVTWPALPAGAHPDITLEVGA